MIVLTIPEAMEGQRLDRALAGLAEQGGHVISRSRISALIDNGVVRGADGPVSRSRKVTAGETFELSIPAPVAPDPLPEAIPLDVVHEDKSLIVVNKPAGMVVHPAPGAETGTLVNALLHHCGDTLAGIGGERRPGIVHRIDKDTSGLLVVAKTEAAHAGLSALFASHDIERRYLAICWGAPDRGDPRVGSVEGVGFGPDGSLRIETRLARHPHDRKRMAVTQSGGRTAITHMEVTERFGPAGKPFAAVLNCQLETGRTHQIRVHATYIGHSLVGDQVYSRPRQIAKSDCNEVTRAGMKQFPRQALHAATLGFRHPISGDFVHFSARIPDDMNDLLTILRRNG